MSTDSQLFDFLRYQLEMARNNRLEKINADYQSLPIQILESANKYREEVSGDLADVEVESMNQ